MNNEIFVLGAGFSKWFDSEMPLLNDLLDSLSPGTLNKINQDVALSRILKSEKNIEKLLSYLISNYPWKNLSEFHNHQSIYVDVLNEITENLLSQQEQCSYELSEDSNKYTFFEYLVNNRPDIITFNYDNILEKCFDKNFQKVDWYKYYNLPIKNLNSRSSEQSNGGTRSQLPHFTPEVPKIIKLHGSINWLFNGSYGDESSESVYHYKPSISSNRTVDINRQGLSSLIIPPSLEKNNFINHVLLKCIWKNAKEAIENCNTINIIGYSFPQSDLYVDLFIKSSVKSNSMINVIDRNDTEAFQKRIRSYFQSIYKRGHNNIRFYTGENCVNTYINEKIKGNYITNN